MLTLVDLRGYDGDPRARLPRATADREAARASVREVIAGIRDRGDAGIREAHARFGIAEAPLRVADIASGTRACDAGLLDAIALAAARIRDYHERQAAEERAPFWRMGSEGAWTGEDTRAVDRAGCLVPGGVAPLASTVLMTVLPARAAGVGSIAVCATPGPDGSVHAATLAACSVVGAEEVYAVGGPPAVAALAYGTETIARADVVVGPGSIWTTIAKHEVAMDVGVDSFAGPTEIVIVADASAPPAFVAADLVAQAEHDVLASCVLVTTSPELIDAVNALLADEAERASRRDDIVSALKSNGRAVLVSDLEQALIVVNAVAPEHVEIMCEGASAIAHGVTTAGAVFVGEGSPVALGDYVAGTNHVLPTAGSARFASPLRVSNFIRSTAVIEFTREGLDSVGGALVALAEAEGLDAHARAVQVRLDPR